MIPNDKKKNRNPILNQNSAIVSALHITAIYYINALYSYRPPLQEVYTHTHTHIHIHSHTHIHAHTPFRNYHLHVYHIIFNSKNIITQILKKNHPVQY